MAAAGAGAGAAAAGLPRHAQSRKRTAGAQGAGVGVKQRLRVQARLRARAGGAVDARWISVESPWGEPSDAILTGRIAGIDVCFLPRHGRGHRIPPGEINYRANIDILKRAGCTDLISLSACGSLKAGTSLRWVGS